MTIYTVQNLNKFADDLEIKIEKFVRWTALAALRGVTEKSPVNTGRFKGSWNVAKGSPNLRVLSPGPASVPKRGSRSGVKSLSVSEYPYVKRYVTNNLDYGPSLEDGHSGQAPNGMVALTLVELQDYMKKTAAKLKNS